MVGSTEISILNVALTGLQQDFIVSCGYNCPGETHFVLNDNGR